MNIHKIQDCSNEHVISILKEGLSKFDNPSSIANYHPDYSNESSNLFYILSQPNNRFTKGNYYVLEEDNVLIACAGWNEYELDTTIALGLTRMFVGKEHRTSYVLGKTVLPLIIEETVNYERLWMTVNEYNLTLYKWFERYHAGKRQAMFSNWDDIYKKFKPIGKRTIYYTEQYVLELENP